MAEGPVNLRQVRRTWHHRYALSNDSLLCHHTYDTRSCNLCYNYTLYKKIFPEYFQRYNKVLCLTTPKPFIQPLKLWIPVYGYICLLLS
jgi:hypothetical protein